MRLRLQVRGRLFLASLGVVGVVLVVAGVVAQGLLKGWIEGRIEDELSHALDAARVAAETARAAPDDALAGALGGALGARVTFIAVDGAVVGDSARATARAEAPAVLKARPEVAQALAGQRGRARRPSVAAQKDTLFLAERWRTPDDDAGGGVVRVAANYDDVDAALARLRLVLAMAGALSLAAAVVMSALASQLLSRTLRAVVLHARALAGARGEGGEPMRHDDDDDIGGIAGTLQKLAEDLSRTVGTLASERDRFAAVLEAMSEGVIGLDAEGRVVLVNAAARDLLRVDAEGVGRSLVELTRVPALDEAAHKAREGEVASVELELPAPVRTLLVRAAPVRAGGAVIVLHDVSEVRRLERVRRDFVSNVSHELRTPVSVIRAGAETLLHGGLEDRDSSRNFLEAIDRNADRLTRLVGDLLDLSRIEAGQVPLAREPLDLRGLCKSAVDDLAGKHTHEVTVEVPERLTAVGDAKAVDQVLVNLLANAVKYTPQGGHVTVRARTGAGKVRVEVVDDGPGIEPKHRARLFERFYRIDRGRSRDVGGTGLGLAIVKHLVEGMGGEVGVEPASPRGSIFFFTLPSQG